MITLGMILSVIAFIACIITPIIGYLVLHRVKATALKGPLSTILIAVAFICAAQAIRVALPLFDQDVIDSLRVFHNTVHLVGDVFAIKAVFELRDYSVVFGLKDLKFGKKKKSKK